jgi:hypothetical protein
VKSQDIIISRKKNKDQIIYVRMQGDDMRKINVLKSKLRIKSRSEMIRTLVVEALKRVRVG